MSLLRVDESVEVGRGPWGAGDTVDVVLLVSRSRIDRQFAGSRGAARHRARPDPRTGAAWSVSAWSLGWCEPLRALADRCRTFDADRLPRLEVPASGITEVRELSEAFDDMTRRLAEQRRFLAASEHRFRELFAASPTPLLELDDRLGIRGANSAAASFLGCDPDRAGGRSVARFVTGITEDELASALASAYLADEAVVEARWLLADGEAAEVELHVRPAGDDRSPGLLMAIHDLTDRVRRLGERWRRTFDEMVDGVALVDGNGEIALANRALQSHLPAVQDDPRGPAGVIVAGVAGCLPGAVAPVFVDDPRRDSGSSHPGGPRRHRRGRAPKGAFARPRRCRRWPRWRAAWRTTSTTSWRRFCSMCDGWSATPEAAARPELRSGSWRTRGSRWCASCCCSPAARAPHPGLSIRARCWRRTRACSATCCLSRSPSGSCSRTEPFPWSATRWPSAGCWRTSWSTPVTRCAAEMVGSRSRSGSTRGRRFSR